MDWLFRFADPTIDWGYATMTLWVRFVGVFLVLAVIQLSIQVAAKAVGWFERGVERRRLAEAPPPSPAKGGPEPKKASPGIDDRDLAAIALALSLESRPSVAGGVRAEEPRGVSPWVMAGRLESLRR